MGREQIPQMPMPDRPISADWGRDVVKCLKALRPVQGVGTMLSRTPNGTIVTGYASHKVSVSQSPEALKPFAVRWHSHGKNGEGSWEVYLPWGCATVGGTACIPLNAAAVGADGKTEIGWYAFTISESDSVETATVGNKIYRSYPVYALLKPWPHLKVSTARADWEDEPWQAKKIIAYAQIAEWTSSSGKQMTSRRVVQYFTGGWEEAYAVDPSSLFGIRYDPNGEASDPSTSWKAMLVNMTVTCGRFQVSSPYDEDVTDMENVVLKIDHSTDGEYALEIVDEAQESTDDATYVTLYRLDHGIVTGDTRTNITTMPFYDV